MTNAINTRPMITINLSSDSEWGMGWEDIDVTKRDLDRLLQSQVRSAVEAAYPEAEVEIERTGAYRRIRTEPINSETESYIHSIIDQVYEDILAMTPGDLVRSIAAL